MTRCSPSFDFQFSAVSKPERQLGSPPLTGRIRLWYNMRDSTQNRRNAETEAMGERILNASVEVNDYAPVTFDELVANNRKFKAAHQETR